MRVCYIHQFFAGPDSPGPEQPRSLVKCLASRGHHVDVIACDFNAYNEQTEVPERYEHPSGGSIQVHRLPAPRKLRSSLRNRLTTYCSFAWSAYKFGKRLPRPDVVMATIQPLFAGYSALRLARRWRRPFLLEIRDLWPDALVVKGAISGWQAAPLERLARSLYFGADRIVSLTPGIKSELLAKGVSAGRLDLFPNGCNAAVFAAATPERDRIRSKYGWDGKFVAVYTGAHTEVTAVDAIVRAATHLRGRPDIRIDLFGAGQTKAAAIALARELALDNVHFHDAVPKSQVPAILAGADAGIISLFKSPLVHIYFENKLIDYLSAGKPILAAADGLQAQLILRQGAGLAVPSLDAEGLARLIQAAADDPRACAEMGARGRAFVQANLAQEVILDRYATILEELARGRELAARIPAWDPLNLS